MSCTCRYELPLSYTQCTLQNGMLQHICMHLCRSPVFGRANHKEQCARTSKTLNRQAAWRMPSAGGRPMHSAVLANSEQPVQKLAHPNRCC